MKKNKKNNPNTQTKTAFFALLILGLTSLGYY